MNELKLRRIPGMSLKQKHLDKGFTVYQAIFTRILRDAEQVLWALIFMIPLTLMLLKFFY